MSTELIDKGYEPLEVEKRWYDFWEKNKMFAADEDTKKKGYGIVIPPPNVTGVLHMGHALNITIQDILCRYRRLRGDSVLWLPGTDHAGIATQNVVERELSKNNISKDEIGREKFIEKVWEWRKDYGSAIINQLKRLGASCDWDRERFTMDEGLSIAVKKVFVELYKQGMIYKGDYIINWCPRCQTALSDLEVEHEDLEGNLYYIRYPMKDVDKHLIVATTRPETMLGDTAVAVNNKDTRYSDMNTDSVILPIANRVIPVIYDNYVDTEFGTGALKVTPAHDPNDFELGVRHKLEIIKVIDDQGKMTELTGKYKGMDRFTCRKELVEELKSLGLLEKIEPITHGVGHCYRCKTIVEPNLSKQWFVKVKPLAQKAIEACKQGKTKIVPDTWTKTYYDWMYNIKDWCISRQIWWGHQIPAWQCNDCKNIMVLEKAPSVCVKCASLNLFQETDVLDTWFSSALWPFSTMGWPEKTKLLENYYPTAVLVTGFDILFFWVARMMMMGIHFMDNVPFKDIYIHALVRDEHGKKMSKSKGNVIDPLHIIEKYGTDAFRFTLTAFAAQGRDIKLSEDRIEGYRHFINKLWNAARFSLMHINENCQSFDYKHLSLPDKWILSGLRRVTEDVESAIENYQFNEAASVLYQFVWHQFCDWYLEAAKPVLYGKYGTDKEKTGKAVLYTVLKNTLILLHPLIPFVTEEIWSKLPNREGSIMKAVFPLDNPSTKKTVTVYKEAEEHMELLINIITGIRTVRGEMNIPPSLSLNVIVQSADEIVRKTLKEHKNILLNLAKLDEITIEKPGSRPAKAATAIVDSSTVFILLEGIVDFSNEVLRLSKEIKKAEKELITMSKKLANESFLSKAPVDVVDKVKTKHGNLLQKTDKLKFNLNKIKEFQDE